MRNNTAVQDARLILQLDRLREEAEMRKARRWWIDEFSPRNAADYLKIEMAHGTQQNKWLRQVTTYWGLAASFVLDGTLGEKAFLRPQLSAEMFDMFAKVQPFLRQLRDRVRHGRVLHLRRFAQARVDSPKCNSRRHPHFSLGIRQVV